MCLFNKRSDDCTTIRLPDILKNKNIDKQESRPIRQETARSTIYESASPRTQAHHDVIVVCITFIFGIWAQGASDASIDVRGVARRSNDCSTFIITTPSRRSESTCGNIFFKMTVQKMRSYLENGKHNGIGQAGKTPIISTLWNNLRINEWTFSLFLFVLSLAIVAGKLILNYGESRGVLAERKRSRY